MLCVIVEPTIKNEYKYTKEYFFISCCKNKRISYTTASSLSEAADIIGRRGGSVLLYAASEKWAINMIRQNSSLGLNLIIAEAFRLQSGSKFSSVCTDVATQISEVCNYLNLCGVKSILTDPLKEETEGFLAAKRRWQKGYLNRKKLTPLEKEQEGLL